MRLSALCLSIISIIGFRALSSTLPLVVVLAALAAGCSSSPNHTSTAAPDPEPAASVAALTTGDSPPLTSVTTAVVSPGSAARATALPTGNSPSPATPTAAASAPITPLPLPTLLPPFVGSTAPDLEFSLFQGEDILGASELHLSDLAGRPVVLNFWARFCGPCWFEMPELQNFYEEQGDSLHLLGIDVGQFTGLGSPKDAGALLGSLGITYPAGYTDDPRVVVNFRVRAMPTTVFIRSDGSVFHSWTGAIDRQQLDAIVSRMLSEE